MAVAPLRLAASLPLLLWACCAPALSLRLRQPPGTGSAIALGSGVADASLRAPDSARDRAAVTLLALKCVTSEMVNVASTCHLRSAAL